MISGRMIGKPLSNVVNIAMSDDNVQVFEILGSDPEEVAIIGVDDADGGDTT